MEKRKDVLKIFLFAGIAGGAICSCGPNDPTENLGNSPVISQIASRSVFVGEPIDFKLNATDPDGDNISISLSSGPSGVRVNASSGLVSWRPALADTGVKTLQFAVSDGKNIASQSAQFTVTMPSLADTEAIRILRPAGGETFTYGDTLVVAFAMKWCAGDAYPEISSPEQFSCSFAPSESYYALRDLNDSTDVDGRVFRFVRRFPDRGLWLGFYKLRLADTTYNDLGCALDFGAGIAIQDSIVLKIKDPYGDTRQPDECSSDPTIAQQIIQGLKYGVKSGLFSVAP